MNEELVQTFLTVYELRNITAAARRLYTTQSTISHRIALLEEEIGTPLFIRQRGMRGVTPTPAGEDFVALAHEWTSLLEATQELAQKRRRSDICIGGSNLINDSTFSSFYQSFVFRHPEIRLRIRTHHATEIYDMLANRQIDVGLVMSKQDNTDAVVKPLYHEEMFVLSHHLSDYPDGIHPKDLPAEKEIYLRWSSNYAIWHNRFWNPKDHLIHAATAMQALPFLAEPGRWAIVPWSTYAALQDPGDLVLSRLSEEPPTRACYLITHRKHPALGADSLDTLLTEIDEYVDTLCMSTESLVRAV